MAGAPRDRVTDVLARQQAAEQEQALRALLMRPLLPAVSYTHLTLPTILRV